MWVCALLMLAILDVFAKFLQIGKWRKVTILLTSLLDLCPCCSYLKELTLEKIRPVISKAKGERTELPGLKSWKDWITSSPLAVEPIVFLLQRKTCWWRWQEPDAAHRHVCPLLPPPTPRTGRLWGTAPGLPTCWARWQRPGAPALLQLPQGRCGSGEAHTCPRAPDLASLTARTPVPSPETPAQATR